jgi:hypothetical protein
MEAQIGDDNQEIRGFIAVQPQEVIDAFQTVIFNLIAEGYNSLKSDHKFSAPPDEVRLSVIIVAILRSIIERDYLPCNVIWEFYELTDEIIAGKVKHTKAKKYDFYFENWNVEARIGLGIEAKLLSENNCKGKNAGTLIKEYVSDKGMGKHINHIYKNRGFMLGYIIEGNVPVIITKINEQIEIVLNKEQCIAKINDAKYTHNEIYISKHPGKLNYDLYHLMLDFN